MKFFQLLFLFSLISCSITQRDKTSHQNVSDFIIVTSPKPFQEVSGTFSIAGEARGTYFFEANFPVEIELENGEIIPHYATALGEWMTVDFVPFSAEIDISHLKPQQISLKLNRANPADLPEHDMQLTIPLIVK